MQHAIPSELMNEIFHSFRLLSPIRDRQLHDFSLICRSWTRPARAIIFHRVVLTSVERTETFVHLLSNSHQTISGGIRDLSVMKGDILECLTRGIVDLDAEAFLPHLQKLLIHRVSWGALSSIVRSALCNSATFGSISVLELSRSTFDTFGEYWSFLHSFTNIHTLLMKDIAIPFDQLTSVGLPKPAPLQLKVVKWMLTYGIAESDSAREWLDNIPLAVNSLLRDCGAHLDEFFLSIDERSTSSTQESRIKSILSKLDMTRNTSLRRIAVSTAIGRAKPTPDFLCDFLRNLTQIPYESTPRLQHLEFSYLNNHQSKLTADLEALDSILQHESFSSLETVICGTFRCFFHVSDFHKYTTINWSDPAETGFKEVDDLRRRFSHCNSRGIFRPIMEPAFYYNHDEEWKSDESDGSWESNWESSEDWDENVDQ
uniref:F-box domain-containing protein n=1 Tax=Moniliophthora roreri TaxID=221103 RepID=A0A0W0GE41_MONRR